MLDRHMNSHILFCFGVGECLYKQAFKNVGILSLKYHKTAFEMYHLWIVTIYADFGIGFYDDKS